jgi:hypothetical protein
MAIGHEDTLDRLGDGDLILDNQDSQRSSSSLRL